MIKLFMESQPKRAFRKLSEINATASGCGPQTPFESLYILSRTELAKPKSLQNYLRAMRGSTLSCENMLKFCVLVHVVTQNGQRSIDPEPLQCFLAELLQSVPSLIEKYENKQFKRDKSAEKRSGRTKSPTRASSCNNSPACSSRSESSFICKEVYLLTHIVRPYIAYLLKFIFGQEELVEVEKRREGARIHEAWMIINLLKLITSITEGFTVIGRYFLSSYGHLVVLLTKALARDIGRMMPLLACFVSRENDRLIVSSQPNQESVEELVRVLEEISILNEGFYTVFLGRYFAKYLIDVPEPKWIITNSRQFDWVYNSLKMQRTKVDAKQTKKRSKSALAPPHLPSFDP